MATDSTDDVTAYPIFSEDNLPTRAATASHEFLRAMQALKPKHAEFVHHFLQSANGTEAAKRAGYAEAHTSQEAYRLLRRADVKAAIDAARTTLAECSLYDVQRAMAEALAGIRFAMETKNANALVKGIELRARLSGLLIERIEVATVDIASALTEARARARTPALIENGEQHD